MNLNRELNIAKELALRAGGVILGIYSNPFEIEYKEDETPITLADRKSNELIIKGLKESFPEHAILSEESEDNKTRLNNDWCWIIDPLDGTKEFIKKNGEFTVNIALAYKHRVVLGVIYLPATGQLYYAAQGIGAFYDFQGNIREIKVSDRTDNLRIVKSRSHSTDKLNELIERNKNRISTIKSAGSSLKGCLIASGEAEVYYRFSLTKEWDTAAMQCIVELAGGIFKQMDHSDMIYNRENTLNDKGFYAINCRANLL